jgi:tryptophan synthase alpha chain
MNRIKELFSKKKSNILSVFYTAGFPSLQDTVSIAQQLEKSGADIIEIGIPFSDPIADGPVIQASNKVALDNGMNLALLLEQVKELRKTVSLPIVLMGYLNPVYQYGIEKFLTDAKNSGVDGLILPDLPLKEFKEAYADKLKELDLCMTFLLSPTTSNERIREIDTASSGFVYAVSASSTTGAKAGFSADQIQYFERLQKSSISNPYLIGFGISDKETYKVANAYASGAIIGSAFIKMLSTSSNLLNDIDSFIKSIR